MKRPCLLPLVPLYAAGLALRNRLAPQPRRLQSPVISVGSLSAGGAGKTPVVLLLAELLTTQGYAVDILTRGYGRTSATTERVDPSGTAARFGDEPLLLAQRTGLPVFVGADRHAAGLLAESQLPPHPNRIHLLDDGFQHRRLARTLDIALLTANDLRDTLLPAGNLREPASALARADILILREEEAAGPVITDALQRMPLSSNPALWTLRRTLDLAATIPSRPLAFCALARPEGFLQMLTTAGHPPAAHLTFPDHHPYRPADIARILTLARATQANAFLTTEKDAVKLTPAMLQTLESHAPVTIARLHLNFPTPEAHIQATQALLSLLC